MPVALDLATVLTPGRPLTAAEAVALSAALEPRWAASRRRLRLRNAALVQAAGMIPDPRPTVRAKALARALGRYAAADYRRARTLDPLQAAMARVLDLNGGKPVAWRTIHEALQNSLEAVATKGADLGIEGVIYAANPQIADAD